MAARSTLGTVLIACGLGVYAVAGIWCFILCLILLTRAWGVIAALIGVLVLPGTLFFFPFYAGFAWDDWLPFMLAYGGTVLGTALVWTGTLLVDWPRNLRRDG